MIENMSEKLKVIIVPVGQKPYVAEIPHTLETLQNIVRGYIEVAVIPIVENVVVVCNENGMIDGLPKNLLGIHGDFLLVGVEPPEFVSLSDEQIEEIMEIMNNGLN